MMIAVVPGGAVCVVLLLHGHIRCTLNVGFSRSGPITMLWVCSYDGHFPAKKMRGPEPEWFVTCRAMLRCFWMIPLATVIGE